MQHALRSARIVSFFVLLCALLVGLFPVSVRAQSGSTCGIGDGPGVPAEVAQAFAAAWYGVPDDCVRYQGIAGNDPTWIQSFSASTTGSAAMIIWNGRLKQAFAVQGQILTQYLTTNWMGLPISDQESAPLSLVAHEPRPGGQFPWHYEGEPISFFERGFISRRQGDTNLIASTNSPAICQVQLQVQDSGDGRPQIVVSSYIDRAPGYPTSDQTGDPTDAYFTVIFPDESKDWEELDQKSRTAFTRTIGPDDLAQPLVMGKTIHFYLDAYNRKWQRSNGYGAGLSSYPGAVVASDQWQRTDRWDGGTSMLRSITLTPGTVIRFADDNRLCPSGASSPKPRPVCLVPDSWQHQHQIIFDRAGASELKKGGALHSGDRFWLSGEMFNPRATPADVTLHMSLSIDGHSKTYDRPVTIPPGGVHSVSTGQGQPFMADDLMPDQSRTRELTIELRDDCGTTVSIRTEVKPRPVVLVYGLTGNPGHWDTFKQKLEEKGREYGICKDLDMGPGSWLEIPLAKTKSIEENATVLQNCIAELQRGTGASQTDILAHSMGGLVSREYIAHLMPTSPRVVYQLIMLGTPNGGSAWAWPFFRSGSLVPATEELTPPWVKEFNSKTMERNGVIFHALAGVARLPFLSWLKPTIAVMLGSSEHDCVVPKDSVNAISFKGSGDSFDTLEQDNTCIPNFDLHGRLRQDDGVFNDYVWKKLSAASSSSAALLAEAPAPAAEPAPATAPADEPVMIELAMVTARAHRAATRSFPLSGASSLAVAIVTADLAPRVQLRAPDGSLSDLPVGPIDTGGLFPRILYGLDAPKDGTYTLILRTDSPQANFSIMVTALVADNPLTIAAPDYLTTTRATSVLSATLVASDTLRSARVELDLLSPSNVERDLRLSRVPGQPTTYANVAALDETGSYMAVYRVRGRLNGKLIQRVRPVIINSEVPAAGVCYAIPDNDHLAGSPDSLVVFDPATALTARLGLPGSNAIEAMVVAPGGAKAYVVQEGVFGTVDLRTGVATFAPAPLGVARGAQGTTRIRYIAGMGIDPTDGSILAVQRRNGSRSDLLVRIRPETGAILPDAFGSGVDYLTISGISRGRVPQDIQDLVRDPLSGAWYALLNRYGQTSMLVSVDPLSGAARVIADTGQLNLEGLSFAADGALYATSGNNHQGDKLYKIDPLTGLTTLIQDLQVDRDYESISCLPGA